MAKNYSKITKEQLITENFHLQHHVDGLKRVNNELKGKVDYQESYITQLAHDYKQLEEKIKKEQSIKNDLEKTHYKAMQSLSHNSEGEIIATLKEDITRLRGERDDKETQIAELKSKIDQLTIRLSKVAADKMVEGNPGLADLSDPLRPQKLVEMFSNLYDNKWTESYEKCSEKGNENQICSYLLELFKESCTFCKEQAEKQLKQLKHALLLTSENKDKNDSNTALSSEKLILIREIRKQTAHDMLPNLYQSFKSVRPNLKTELYQYIDGCLEISWYSTIHEPPINYVFEAKDQPEDFRTYTKTGKRVDFVVWPAMYLYATGPILCKGVVQFKD